MDIKDYILIGGGLLIAAVVVHGFWIAWRSRQEPLRIDIQPDLIPDAVSDIERLRGELPNGGARIVNGAAEGRGRSETRQEPLPLLLEPTEGPPKSQSRPQRNAADGYGAGTGSRREAQLAPEFSAQSSLRSETRTEPLLGAAAADDSARVTVAQVDMPEQSMITERPLHTDGQSARRERRVETAARRNEATERKVDAGRRLEAARKAERKTPERAAEKTPLSTELIILNIVAPPGAPYTGDTIFEVLRAKGLKFGEMNIFHRIDPATKAVHYSIANVVEPGTFDMADMEAFTAPGLCMFMQLPGPEHPAAAFEDMMDVAGEITARLGGEISDEQRNRVTLQTVEHYRQRIADFSRRRMSKRA